MDGQLHSGEEKIMSKVCVLYCSSYGHIEAMAAAVAEEFREAGARVTIKHVPKAGGT